MTTFNTPDNSRDDEPVAGEPLLDPPTAGQIVTPVEPVEPVQAEPVRDVPVPTPPVTEVPAPAEEPDDSGGGGKAKTAALVAGAAALAGKVRQEAPKIVQQVREKRAAGRCVIVTEADGQFLAVGPYKNEDAAREDIFKVGGTPRVAELVSQTSFFQPPQS